MAAEHPPLPPAGMLDRRFQLHRPRATLSQRGGPEWEWVPAGHRWGRLAVDGGAERQLDDGRIRSVIEGRICIRPHKTLDEGWRLRLDGVDWAVEDIEDHDDALMTLRVVSGEETA